MAEQPKKPRDLKDLKAKLGRPGGATQSSPGSIPVPATTGVMGGSVPPPVVGGVVPAPAAVAPVAPVGLPGFMQPPKPFGQRQQDTSRDPFAPGPAAPAGPQEVRLVIDEKPVDDAEIGRKNRSKNFIIIAVGLLAGLAFGFGIGSTTRDRSLYNQAVRDGKDILNTVTESSRTVLQAQKLVTSAVSAAQQRRLDAESIESLRALKKPFDAGTFSRKKYSAFTPGTVDALFEYYNNVNVLWDRFAVLSARTLSETNRRAIETAAAAAGNLATVQYGVVPIMQENVWAAGLVIVQPPPPGQEPPPELQVASAPGRATVGKTRYAGQDLSQNPSNYVLLVDTASSMPILGQQASAFAEYSALLLQIKQLMDATVEVQGRLTRELGEIAKLEEVFAL